MPQVHPETRIARGPGDPIAPGAPLHSPLIRESGDGAGIRGGEPIPIPQARPRAAGATLVAARAARVAPLEPDTPFGASGLVPLAGTARAIDMQVQAVESALAGAAHRH